MGEGRFPKHIVMVILLRIMIVYLFVSNRYIPKKENILTSCAN